MYMYVTRLARRGLGHVQCVSIKVMPLSVDSQPVKSLFNIDFTSVCRIYNKQR